MNIISVGIGGCAGAVLRYLIGSFTPLPHGFPLGTLIINLLGCFFLSWFFTITAVRLSIVPHLRLAIGTGFTGAFTTFSAFSVETLQLMQNEQFFLAVSYVCFSVLGGVLSALGGKSLAAAGKHSRDVRNGGKHA